MIAKRFIVGAILITTAVLTAVVFVMIRSGNDRYVYVPNDVRVTIPEGTNLADIQRILMNSDVGMQGSLLTSANLKNEGKFFPDTYRFDKDSSAEKVTDIFLRNYATRTRGLAVEDRTLNIASILEKEVKTESDMKIVAGIIEKRLKAGMALQLDATVAYGACVSKFNLGEYCDASEVNIVDNLKRDSAYNTYTRVGLPIGPISNPGLVALRSASNPQDSPYWYYLSARNGTTIFSKTLDEHIAAKNKYLR